MQLRMLEEANRELDDAAAHYALEYKGRARRFLVAYRDALDVALTFPSSAPPITNAGRHVIRSYSLHHFPYTIFAAIDDNEFVVLAVAHQKRRPGYWVGRIHDIEP